MDLLESIAASALAETSARVLAPRLAEAPLRECARRIAVGKSLAARADCMSMAVRACDSAKRWRRDSYRLRLPPVRLSAVAVSIPGMRSSPEAAEGAGARTDAGEIGRASCREGG